MSSVTKLTDAVDAILGKFNRGEGILKKSLQQEFENQRKRRKESSKIMQLKLMMPNAASKTSSTLMPLEPIRKLGFEAHTEVGRS